MAYFQFLLISGPLFTKGVAISKASGSPSLQIEV